MYWLYREKQTHHLHISWLSCLWSLLPSHCSPSSSSSAILQQGSAAFCTSYLDFFIPSLNLHMNCMLLTVKAIDFNVSYLSGCTATWSLTVGCVRVESVGAIFNSMVRHHCAGTWSLPANSFIEWLSFYLNHSEHQFSQKQAAHTVLMTRLWQRAADTCTNKAMLCLIV